jgi:hypothetical protein
MDHGFYVQVGALKRRAAACIHASSPWFHPANPVASIALTANKRRCTASQAYIETHNLPQECDSLSFPLPSQAS